MAEPRKRRSPTKQAKPQPAPVGRPSKYDPAFCDQIVAFCADGYSITAFAGSLGVSRDTISEWAKVHPEFSAAVKSAKASAAFWWETRGRQVGQRGGGPGTATMIIFNLKNMAPDDYADKQEHQHSGPGGGAIQHGITVEFVKPKVPDGEGSDP